MKIGFSVEGSTDRALLRGLKDRWCPDAELVEGGFRGSTRLRRHREIPRICVELAEKGADVIIILRDANEEDWREALRAEQAHCRPEHQHLTIFGVCSRNVESWLCADADWLARETGRAPDEFRVLDPKAAVEVALKISGIEKREPEVASLVSRAPLKRWLANISFEAFYDALRQKSLQMGCSLENIRERIPS